MELIYKKIGDLVKLVDVRNVKSPIKNVQGINISKNFMPSIANTVDTDISKYKVIRSGQFAYSAMQVGRDEVIRVVLYTGNEPAIISPAYQVFEVIDLEQVVPEYLMMWFQRAESDRYGWFISDGSVRASLEWERFCEIEIPVLLDVKRQMAIASIYSNLQAADLRYKESIKDLNLLCDGFMSDAATKYPVEKIGPLIARSGSLNAGLGIESVRGISTNKGLIRTKANMTDVSLHDYQLLKTGEFVYTPDTSRRGDKIALALNREGEVLVSKIYTVFKSIRPEILISEYLFLWFRRPDFDRYARFHSWGSVRETFDWSDMENVSLPIPPVKVQESIVAIFAALESRQQLNERIKNLIAVVSPVLFSGVISDAKKGKA